MSEGEQVEQDRKALEALIVNNTDLERLEVLFDKFNIFEVIGVGDGRCSHERTLDLGVGRHWLAIRGLEDQMSTASALRTSSGSTVDSIFSPRRPCSTRL